MSYRPWPLALMALTTLASGCAEPASRPPNVVLIVVDTLRGDYLGYQGFDGDISPHIDRLAGESVVFRNAVAQAPWTAPSMASLLTSLHPQTHCVYADGEFCGHPVDRENDWGALNDDATTLAEVFAEAGYETAGFVGNYLLKTKFGFRQGFEHYSEPQAEDRHATSDAGVFQAAYEWLRDRTDPRPYFLYVHFMDIHTPYRPEPEDFAAIVDSPGFGEDHILSREAWDELPLPPAALLRWSDPALVLNVRNWRAAYGAGIRTFDRKLGGFLEYVDLDDCLLVFASDHGEEFQEHGAWRHGLTYYNEALRVPLFFRPPGGRERPRHVDRTVSLIDIMPTLIARSGLDEHAPRGMQGRDLSAWLSDGADAAAGAEVWAFSTGSQEEPAAVVAQNGRHKLILHRGREPELYDLEADPGEQNDLAPTDGKLVDSLTDAVRRHLARLQERESLTAVDVRLDAGDIEKLRNLGYVQ